MKLRKGSNEEWVFSILRTKADLDTNIVEFDPIASGNKDKFNKGVAILKLENIIAKVNNGVYMVNPNVLRPMERQFSRVLKQWVEISKKNY